MNVQFVIVCILFLASFTFGISCFFYEHKSIEKADLKTPSKGEKLIKKSKLVGFVFLVVAVAIPVIVFL